jgi:hypothetical protein
VGIDLPIFKWTRELLRGPEAAVEHRRAEVQAERSGISRSVWGIGVPAPGYIAPIFERAVASGQAGGRRESNGVKKRIPAVEDEPGLCLALQDWLEGEGCKVNMDRSRFKRAEDDSLGL